MKQLLRYIFILLVALVATTNAYSGCYVYGPSGEYSTTLGLTMGEFIIPDGGAGGVLSYKYKLGNNASTTHYATAQWYNGSKWQDLKVASTTSKSYPDKPITVTIPTNAQKIRFKASADAGGIRKVYVNEVAVTRVSYADAPQHTSWEPTALVGSAASSAETTMAWSNTTPFTLSLTGEGASQFTCNITNNASTCKYGIATISATYKHDVAGTHEAKLTITTAFGSHTINLKGTTTKKDQFISWNDTYKEGKLALGQEVDDAATATSGLTVTYSNSTSDESVIKIINGGAAFRAVGEGSATIIATQAGNVTEWNSISSTKTFTVTAKKIQTIHWIDNLTRFKVGDAPVTLTAAAQIVISPETGETQDIPERDPLITYQSADNSVVSVNGNILTIVGEGETTVTATLPGDNDTYEEATLTMPVRVRVPSTTCETYVLEATEEFSIEYSLFGQERIYEPAAFSGPGHILTFEARKNNSTAVGNIQIQQYVNGEWRDIDDANPGTDWRSYYCELDRNATKIRFYNGYGSYTRYFKNVLVTQATYLETSTPTINVDRSIVGDQITQYVAVQYSNLSAGVTVSHTSDKIQVSHTELPTDCGKYGEEFITITCTPTAAGMIEDILTVHDEATNLTLTIPVTIHTQHSAQYLDWAAPAEPIASCSELLLPIHTSANLPITWSITQGEEYAALDQDNNLMIYANGTITLKAEQTGNQIYAPLEEYYTIQVFYNPIFIGAESRDWNNPANWNICRVPEIEELKNKSMKVSAPMELDKELTINEIIIEDNGLIYITKEGGLTVLGEGISGAKEDGSSIIIDNKPEGAGYFRIDPNATNKPTKVTVNYTTKTYDNGTPRQEVWQYIGMPGSMAHMIGLDSKVTIYNWDETRGWLKQSYNQETNIPAWTGFAFTQSEKELATFTIKSEPIYADRDVYFTCTPSGMKGDNLMVNSYLAPIDITKIEEEDVYDPYSKLTKTFFIFNAGSWNDWSAGGDITANGYDQSSAGHYYSIPFYSAKNLPAGESQLVIPSMQGVYVYTEGEATLRLKYKKHVIGAESINNLNQAVRAPKRVYEDNFRRVCLQATSENSGADRMYIMQDTNTTPDYDNGYDGDNIIANGQVNIYTTEHFGQMEVSCSNDIDSMYIGFTAGSDTEYTLNVSAVVGDDMFLIDLDNETIIPIEDKEQYIFYAKPNSVNDRRFMLIKQSVSDPNEGQGGVTTNVEDIISKQNLWVFNNTVYVSEAPANSTLAIYTANGVSVTAPYTIHHTPYTLNLSHLPAGVYVIRLNNQAYKFVCE